MSGVDEEELWNQLDQLLERRPGWRFQGTATPGEPPVWTFGARSEIDLFVTVDEGSIHIYDEPSEREVRLGSTEDLVAWLNTQKPGSLQPQKGKVDARRKRASFFRWE